MHSSPRGSCPGSSPGQGHCAVVFDKTLYSYSASLHPGVKMDTCGRNAGGYSVMDSQLLHATETVG